MLKIQSLTIGTFDGVHLGHQFLLKALKRPSLILTFKEPPSLFFHPRPFSPILSLEERILRLKHFADHVEVLTFSKEIAEMTYQEFLLYLLQSFSFSELVLGEDALFGKNREGTPEKVSSFLAERNIQTRYLPLFLYDEKPVSSSRIRKLLLEGRQLEADLLLGKP